MTLKQVYSGNPKNYLPPFFESIKELKNNGIFGNTALTDQIDYRKKTFSQEARKELVSIIRNQYLSIENPKAVGVINTLEKENSFTVTTGQQIHVFLGPMYVQNKILSAVKKAKEIKVQHPNIEIIPIFWMATEDHDMEEIDHVFIHGEKYTWDHNHTGISGTTATKGLVEVLDNIVNNKNGVDENIINVYKYAYTNFNNLADATRYLVDYFYGDLGVLVIDANDKQLKARIKKDIITDIIDDGFSESLENQTQIMESAGIVRQINPRKTNYFYLDTEARNRIIKDGEKYLIGDSTKTQTELIKAIEDTPELFSPNVAMRPLFQERVLPNLVYLAGPSEYIYWQQLKLVFETANCNFPLVELRDSVIISNNKKHIKLLNALSSAEDLFLSNELFNEKLNEHFFGISPTTEIVDTVKQFELKFLEDLRLKQIPNLSKYKDHFEVFKTETMNLFAEFESQRMNSPNITNQINGLQKIKDQYYSIDKKWERNVSILELQLFVTHEIIQLNTIENDAKLHIYLDNPADS
jgi:bacillithiol biosynthesis cysteine-adding enzyme BshC